MIIDKGLGGLSQYFISISIPIINISWSPDLFILIMGIPMPGKWEPGPKRTDLAASH